MFEQTFIANSGKRRPWTYVLGLIGELLALGVMMLLPLIYTEKIGGGLSHLPMIYPPPQRPKPPAPAERRQRQVLVRQWKPYVMYTPTSFPPKPAILLDHPIDATSEPFVPGPAMGGLHSGGVVGSIPDFAPPPPERTKPVETAVKPVVKPDKPIRVGGTVLEAKIIRRIIPIYPPLAKQARVQGVVKLEGVIARDGTIQQLRVISGHALLIAAAVDAVRQWVYRPTFLNGEAVEVQAPIDVNFTLSQ